MLQFPYQPVPLIGPPPPSLPATTTTYRWPATVGFSDAPIPYRILGNAGCLQFFDVTFRGDDRIVELEPNRSYPGTTT